MIPGVVWDFLKEVIKDKETMRKLAEYSSRDFWYIIAIFILIFSSVKLASQLIIAEQHNIAQNTCDEKIKPVVAQLALIVNERNYCLEALDSVLGNPDTGEIDRHPPLSNNSDDDPKPSPVAPPVPPRRRETDINDLINMVN